MKTFRAKNGPFLEQPFYEPAEIEFACADELRKLDLYPSDPAPIRIDRFIEKRFGIQPTYETLPKGLLGFTQFGSNGVVGIVVANALDEEGTLSAERRLRTTLAHEAGHGLLHAHLFALEGQPKHLLEDRRESDSPRVLCREGGISGVESVKKPPYRWWEFQANQAMAALLVPKSLLEKLLSSMIVRRGTIGLSSLPEDRREEAVRLIADTFNVNPVVGRLRLESVYPQAEGDRQLTM